MNVKDSHDQFMSSRAHNDCATNERIFQKEKKSEQKYLDNEVKIFFDKFNVDIGR